MTRDEAKEAITYIAENVPYEDRVNQLSEECGELVAACAKVVRILHGNNPTPVTLYQAMTRMKEEAWDVLVCMDVAGISLPEIAEETRLMRWQGRLKEKA